MTAIQGLKSVVVELSNKELAEVTAAAQEAGMTLDEFTPFAISETLGRRLRHGKKGLAQVCQIRKKPR
ncbi:MAG: hypothetical protein ACYC4K_08295 [Thiobacillus sp.]